MQKAVEQLRTVRDINPTMKNVRYSLEEAENLNEEINLALRKMTGKGL